jgi:hypothetical protein
MSGVPSQDEDPININEEEKVKDDAEDLFGPGGGGRGYVETEADRKERKERERRKKVSKAVPLPPDAEDFLCLGGGGRGYVEHNTPKHKHKTAKSFAEKRKDEEMSTSDLF